MGYGLWVMVSGLGFDGSGWRVAGPNLKFSKKIFILFFILFYFIFYKYIYMG
jgi:hypothetical protein